MDIYFLIQIQQGIDFIRSMHQNRRNACAVTALLHGYQAGNPTVGSRYQTAYSLTRFCAQNTGSQPKSKRNQALACFPPQRRGPRSSPSSVARVPQHLHRQAVPDGPVRGPTWFGAPVDLGHGE